MIHRDIKPNNILVVDNGTTYPSFKLADFGCALLYQRQKASRPARCGTFEWQPPENPVINTRAADIWALGASTHFLATGQGPLQSIAQYTIARWNENNGHPASAQNYNPPARYYATRVPREVTPINLSTTQQIARGIAPYINPNRADYNHQYSDELNGWMSQCLRATPGRRPTVQRLLNSMTPMAKDLLKQIGGQAALTDLDFDSGP